MTDVSQSDDLASLVAGRIPVRNAWYLLLYAWDLAAWRGRWKAASEQSPSLLGLLARILTDATLDLLKRQLGRSYAPLSETIRGIRGRIDFATSLKRLTFEQVAVHCTFSELTIDTLKNRILRATLHRLVSDPRLVSAKHLEEAELRHDLRSVVRAMDGVAFAPVTSTDFSRLQLGRNDRDYLLPIAICSLVHHLEMPTEDVGDHALTALLRDEIKFHELYEHFVRNFYRYHLDDYEVGPETLKWYDELGCEYVPAMRTDITITQKRPPFKRLIIDTKFSTSTLSVTPYGGLKFKSDNLYQIYAYLRTQEQLSDSHSHADGMLLYPTVGEDLDNAMRVQGHRIRVATVNLSQPWEKIEARLLALISIS